MIWKKFFDWLLANGVRYSPGDMHWAGRGYWFPQLPDTSTGAVDPLPVEPWLRVSRDMENANVVYITTSYGRDLISESPEDARQIVEQVLMEMDELMGAAPRRRLPSHVAPAEAPYRRGKPMRPEGLTRRDEFEARQRERTVAERVQDGTYISHGSAVLPSEVLYRERKKKWDEMLESRPAPKDRPDTSREYKGEALKLRGLGALDEGVSSACDDGFHERCGSDACECACHVKTRIVVARCGCGKEFDLTGWKRLKVLGYQDVEADKEGPACKLELRNCKCGSTLAIET